MTFIVKRLDISSCSTGIVIILPAKLFLVNRLQCEMCHLLQFPLVKPDTSSNYHKTSQVSSYPSKVIFLGDPGENAVFLKGKCLQTFLKGSCLYSDRCHFPPEINPVTSSKKQK